MRAVRGARLGLLVACATAVVSYQSAAAAAGPVITKIADVASGPLSMTADASAVALASHLKLDGSSMYPDGGVFIFNVATGTFSRQARLLSDTGTYQDAHFAVISSDGKTAGLVFDDAGGLGTGSSERGGIYVRNLASGDLAPVAPDVTPTALTISGDGRVLAYTVADDSGHSLLYVVSAAGGGSRLIDTSLVNQRPSLSGDGRFLSFTHYALSPVSADGVFVHDLTAGATERASSDSAGHPGTGGYSSISGDGQVVAFRSADELVPGAGPVLTVYAKDRTTGETTLVSTTAKDRIPQSTSSPGDDECCSPTSISADGRYVAFVSAAPLTPDKTDNTIRDLWIKDRLTGAIVRIPMDQNYAFNQGDFALSGDGHTLVFKKLLPGAVSGELDLARLPAGNRTCDTLGPPQEFGLTPEEQRVLDLRLGPTAAEVTAARNALRTDARRHPGNKGLDARELKQLNAIIYGHQRVADVGAHAAEDVPKLIDDAKCALLEQAHDSLVAYLEEKGHGAEATLADKLIALRDVLRDEADSNQKAELLKANVAELIERIGGKDAAKKYGPVVNEVYGLLKAYLSGTLKEHTRKTVTKQLIKAVKKASQKWFGRDAPELVDHLLALRDVIAGSPDDAQRVQVLKDSIAGLSLRLLGKNLLNTPQVRAAMFGFELGKAFGARIAEDLNLIANLQLEKDCAVALSAKQSTPGAVNYGEATQATVPKPLWHEGWHCVIEPDGYVPGYPGGVVQATPPANASVKDKILWRITTTGSAVLYDPRFAHG